MGTMKLWITECIDEGPGILLGPYIQADSIEKANSIAIQHGLYVIGQIVELIHEEPKERTIH